MRSRVRERRLWILALFMLAIPLVLSLIAIATMYEPSGGSFTAYGAMLSGFAVFSHGALLVLLSSLGAAQRISQERERRTLPALVNSPLSPRRIADGKLMGAWAFTLWLSFLTLPFIAIASVWGGLSFAALVAAWLLNVAAALASASLALGLSGLFGRSLSAYLATGAVLFLWCAVIPAVGGMTMGAFIGTGVEFLHEALCAASFYHLPLAPQVMIFVYGLGEDSPNALPFVTAIVVWVLVALLGRLLAISGLRREVF